MSSLNFAGLGNFGENKQSSTPPTTTPQKSEVDHNKGIRLSQKFAYDDESSTPPPVKRENIDKPPAKPLVNQKPIELTHREVEALINKNAERVSRMQGIDSARIITSEVLIKAPANYFEPYNEDCVEILKNVRDALSADANVSQIIQVGNQDPTNVSAVNQAYNAVYRIATTEINKKKEYQGLRRRILMALIVDEVLGFSRLDPLWRDDTIDEISCSGPNKVIVQMRGKWIHVPACRFTDREHLEALIERLYSGLNKTVSKTNPEVDGRLHDNSRLHTTHVSMSPDGPNFSIRRHREEYIPPSRLITWGTANEELLTYIGNLLYKGCSALVIGGTGTGKTTTLAALTGFYRNDHKIVTLEDNIELKISPKKMKASPMQCIEARPDMPGSGADMRRLVKASLRMSPDILIVGEVRDGSAFDLTQALNTGHYGMSTIHANGPEDSINRVSSMIKQDGIVQGDGALPLIGSAFDIIITLRHYSDGSRKIVSVDEVGHIPERRPSGELYLPVTPLYKFEAEPITMENPTVRGTWVKKNELSELRRINRDLDLTPDLTWEELKELSE